jgi:nucleotide-binding universal stress UspA family protein
MYKRIAVAYNSSAEAGQALSAAISLAKAFGSELRLLTHIDELPSYTAYAAAADPALQQTLAADRQAEFEELQTKVRQAALRNGIVIQTELLEGDDVGAIVHLLYQHKIDLLVIALHRHSLYLSRLWNSVYDLADDAPCSVLGVR